MVSVFDIRESFCAFTSQPSNLFLLRYSSLIVNTMGNESPFSIHLNVLKSPGFSNFPLGPWTSSHVFIFLYFTRYVKSPILNFEGEQPIKHKIRSQPIFFIIVLIIIEFPEIDFFGILKINYYSEGI